MRLLYAILALVLAAAVLSAAPPKAPPVAMPPKAPPVTIIDTPAPVVADSPFILQPRFTQTGNRTDARRAGVLSTGSNRGYLTDATFIAAPSMGRRGVTNCGST